MSAIAGMILFGGESIDRQAIEAIAQPAPGDRVDAIGIWENEGIAFSHALARVTLESLDEQQPLVDPTSGCAITFDGRIDNREELGAHLEEELGRLGSVSDAAFVLGAYTHWGDGCLSKLLGDFAFAIWNPQSKQLVLARDPMGQRTLFYSLANDRLIFASTLEQMLRAPGIPHDWDEDALARHMYWYSSVAEQTPFRAIKSLPDASVLLATQGSVKVERYWNLAAEPPPLRDLTDDDLDNFRDLFAKAVRCRLRSSAPVGLLMSGGLDSSSIACMAAHLELGTRLHTFSLVFDQVPSCDERRYIQAMLDRYALDRTLLVADDWGPLSNLAQWLPVFTEPSFLPLGAAILKALECAKSAGTRVVLMGHGADTLPGGSPTYLADWLLAGRLRAVDQQVRRVCAATGRRYASTFLVNAVLPYMPFRLRETIEYRGWPDIKPIVPMRWQAQRMHEHGTLHHGKYAWWHALWEGVQFGQTPHDALLNRMGRVFGIEIRQPFLDVRLVEFLMRLPPQAGYYDGATKYILRSSLRDLVPDIIRNRRIKSSIQPFVDHSLRGPGRAIIQALIQDSELARQGYVNARPWQMAIQDYLDGKRAMYGLYWNGLTLELWLRKQMGTLPQM